jgi:antitoxin YefM
MAMRYVSFAELQQNLERHLDEIGRSRVPFVVTRPSGAPIVMLSLAEYEGMKETFHLLRNPANAERLFQSIADADAGKFVEHDLDE